MDQNQEIACPICRESAKREETADLQARIDCPRCGVFLVTRDFEEDFPNEHGLAHARHLVSGACREATLARTTLPPLTVDHVRHSLLPGAPKTISAQLNSLLWALSRLVNHPGDLLEIDPERDYPLAYLRPDEDLWYYLNALQERKLVVLEPAGDDLLQVQITPAGWEWLEGRGESKLASDTVFVAMSFSSSLRSLYENGLVPAIRQAGYRPVRIDYVEHADLIVDRIMASIREARFVVADLTEGKPGVYLEAGYALGLGIPVIWTCRRGEDVHFDVKQFNQLRWTDEEELSEHLRFRILAVIGRGPLEPGEEGAAT